MSDRGSILISTANDIGEALVEKLEGSGYSPAEWRDEINKLGIAEVDSAPALSVLEDSSETGTARGSILLSTANAIGAVLNKKYNTDRGFKPKEWASATRKMKALETDTKSGSIVNIQGAKDTPLLSLVGTIDPTIEGTSEVSAVKLGKNIFDVGTSRSDYNRGQVTNVSDGVVYFEVYTSGNTFAYRNFNITTFGEFSISAVTSKKGGRLIIRVRNKADTAWLTNNDISITGWTYNAVFGGWYKESSTTDIVQTVTIPKEGASYWQLGLGYANTYVTAGDTETFSNVMVEVGSSASTYEPYKNPTTYTADLGETVHGGSVDFTSGEVIKDVSEPMTFDGSESWQADSTRNGVYLLFSTMGIHNYGSGACNLFPVIKNSSGMASLGICFGINNYAIYIPHLFDGGITGVTDVSSWKTYLENNDCTICYPLATPAESSITPIEIDTSGDVENYYTSAGDTSIEYYAVPTPYTRGTASGAIANVQSARTDLPFTKVKANIAPNLTGVSEVKVFNTGAGLVTVPDVSGSITNAYFYNIPTGYTLTAGVTYKITMAVNSTVTPFAVSVGVGDDSAYRYDIYNTGIMNKNGVVSFEFTPDSSHLATWNKLWIRAPRYSDPSVSQQTTCTFTVTNILLYTSEPTVYTADLGEPVYGGYADLVSGTGKKGYSTPIALNSLTWSKTTISGHEAFYSNLPDGYIGLGSGVVGGDCDTYDITADANLGTDETIRFYYNANFNISRCVIRDDQYASLTGTQFKEIVSGNIVYELAENARADFAFDGQVISPSEGVNNLWNNAGGDTDVEYFTQE